MGSPDGRADPVLACLGATVIWKAVFFFSLFFFSFLFADSLLLRMHLPCHRLINLCSPTEYPRVTFHDNPSSETLPSRSAKRSAFTGTWIASSSRLMTLVHPTRSNLNSAKKERNKTKQRRNNKSNKRKKHFYGYIPTPLLQSRNLRGPTPSRLRVSHRKGGRGKSWLFAQRRAGGVGCEVAAFYHALSTFHVWDLTKMNKKCVDCSTGDLWLPGKKEGWSREEA